MSVEFKGYGRSDYALIVFAGPDFLVKMPYVDDLHAAADWLTASRQYGNWTAFNVYVRRSRRFLFQYRRGVGFLPRRPQ